MDSMKLASILRLVADALTEEPKKTENKPVSPFSDNDPEQPNNYQKLLNKFSYRPFEVDKAVRCFKQGTMPQTMLILKNLEVEGLATPLDEMRWQWILVKP